jgi:hypothetical protein
MRPAPQDLDITRGDFFSFFFRIKDKNPDGSTGDFHDLTGWTGIAQIRESVDAPTPLAEFDINFADQTAYPGGVLISLDEVVTATLNFTGNTVSKVIGVWDVQLTNELGEPNTFLTGNVTLWKDVSRPVTP